MEGPGKLSQRHITMTNKSTCDVCGRPRGYSLSYNHRKCSKIRQARGFDWMYQPKEVSPMSNIEECNSARDTAKALSNFDKLLSANDIAKRLNEAFEGLYYVSDDKVYLQAEPDYLKPHLIIRIE